MDVEKRLLRTWNDLLSLLRGNKEAMAYLRERAEKSESTAAKAAFENLESGLPWTKVQVLLDIVRRCIWPNRELVQSLLTQLQAAKTQADKAKVHERLAAISEANVQQGAMGADLVLSLLEKVDFPLKEMITIAQGAWFLAKLCERIAELEKWDQRGKDTYRLFH